MSNPIITTPAIRIDDLVEHLVAQRGESWAVFLRDVYEVFEGQRRLNDGSDGVANLLYLAAEAAHDGEL